MSKAMSSGVEQNHQAKQSVIDYFSWIINFTANEILAVRIRIINEKGLDMPV